MTMKSSIPDRKIIPHEHQWDLSPLFDSEETWESLYRDVDAGLQGYEAYRGRLDESAERFKEALDFHLTGTRRMEKLYTYAHLRNDEDQSNQHYLGMVQRARNLLTKASEMASFLVPEIQTITDARIQAFMQKESLAEYRFYLEKILRFKPHTLGEKEEHLLAMLGDLVAAPRQVFGQLDNVDLSFGTLKDGSGSEVELSHGNFSTFLIDPEPEVRKDAFFQYYSVYDSHKNTLAATLASSVKKDLFLARARRFKRCLSAGLFGDNIPEAVVENLIRTVRANLKPLHTYLKFRKKVLKLKKLHFFDTYVPIVPDVQFRMSYEEAVEVCIKALCPLGENYTRPLKEGLLGGWVDRYENKGKRSGAYSSGCYDSPPYILLNYEEDNLNSVYTLIHEAGHSMHSYFSKMNQAYVDHDYTIFVAEVASTFNENLLSRYLLKTYENDPKMKAYIINREIDNIRATLFRQTMFAEFENRVHQMAEDHLPLTLESMTRVYDQLLHDYFGNTLVIDPELRLECLRIPHFYSAFYVYKYATGVSAAIDLADKVIRGGAEFRDAYLRFLTLGGSLYPLDELQVAGADMRSPASIEKAITRLDRLVDQLMSLPL